MRYTIYTYQPEGFGAGWKETQADTIPKGAVSVEVWDRDTMNGADKAAVYVIDTGGK